MVTWAIHLSKNSNLDKRTGDWCWVQGKNVSKERKTRAQITGLGNMFSLDLLGEKWMQGSFSFQCGLARFQEAE